MRLTINPRPSVENVGKLPQRRLRVRDPLELRPPMRTTPHQEPNVDLDDHESEHFEISRRKKTTTMMMMRALSMFLQHPNRPAGTKRNHLPGRSRRKNWTTLHLPKPKLEDVSLSLLNPSPLPREE